MKKLLFLCAVVAIAILTSCEKKVERVQIVEDIYTEQVTVDGSVGHKLVKLSDAGATMGLSDQVYTKVTYDSQAKLILAYSGSTFTCFNLEGQSRGAGGYEKIKTLSDGKVYLTGANKTTLYLPEKGSVFGPYDELNVIGNKIFAKGPKGWGLLDTDYNYLQDMVFEKLYIINQKSEKDYDVLRCRAGKWEMVSSDESVYDEPSVKAAVKLLNKKAKPSADIGVLDMKF